MGQIEIVEKINRELKNEIIEECHVVFILSRMRKVLEINNQKSKYELINFYSNWVLHSKLDGPSTIRIIKNIFEQDIDCAKSAKENANKIKISNKKFFVFSNLKQQMDDFFNEYNLSVGLLNNNWTLFVKLLLDIIKECPIILGSLKLSRIELLQNDKGIYFYKFYLVGLKDKPIIKLKFK